MKLMKLNKKGFTLVELLAVIVVLAIIMIIAVPSVLKSMNNAKKGAFKIEAQKVLSKAQEVYSSDEMLGTFGGTPVTLSGIGDITTGYFYTLSNLGMENTGSYKGYAIVGISATNNTATYYVTLSDKSFSVRNNTDTDLNGTNAISSNKISNYDSLDTPSASYDLSVKSTSTTPTVALACYLKTGQTQPSPACSTYTSQSTCVAITQCEWK